MGPIHSIEDLIDFLRRRARLILAVAVLGAVVSVVYAAQKQRLFLAVEVLQVQAPMVADSLAPSTIAASSARRLQLIEQKLMSRDELLDIIDTLGLYADAPALTPSEKAQLLRESVVMTGVAAAREGFGDDGTVSALRISATMSDPVAAQQVAHEFALRTIALSEVTRLEKASDTLTFFRLQEQTTREAIATLETEIAAFHKETDAAIPGGLAVRRREIETINDGMLTLDRQIATAQGIIDSGESSASSNAVERRQVAAARQDLASLTVQRDLLTDRLATLSASIEATPEIERKSAAYDRRLQDLQSQLEGIATKRSEAEVSYQLEVQDQSERLMVIEPATVPDYAISRSRRVVALIGALASILVGLGMAFALELYRPVIRTAAQMERETGLKPIVSVPPLKQQPPKRAKRG